MSKKEKISKAEVRSQDRQEEETSTKPNATIWGPFFWLVIPFVLILLWAALSGR